MKVYLASNFEEASRLRAWRDEHFARYKLTCTSSWLEVAASKTTTGAKMPSMGESDEHRCEMARLDVEDVLRSDALVLFNDLHLHGRGRGGRHVELGIALGWNEAKQRLSFNREFSFRPKLIVVVGVRENVFHYHDQVRWAPDDDAALALLDAHHRFLDCCKEKV